MNESIFKNVLLFLKYFFLLGNQLHHATMQFFYDLFKFKILIFLILLLYYVIMVNKM